MIADHRENSGPPAESCPPDVLLWRTGGRGQRVAGDTSEGQGHDDSCGRPSASVSVACDASVPQRTSRPHAMGPTGSAGGLPPVPTPGPPTASHRLRPDWTLFPWVGWTCGSQAGTLSHWELGSALFCFWLNARTCRVLGLDRKSPLRGVGCGPDHA